MRASRTAAAQPFQVRPFVTLRTANFVSAWPGVLVATAGTAPDDRALEVGPGAVAAGFGAGVGSSAGGWAQPATPTRVAAAPSAASALHRWNRIIRWTPLGRSIALSAPSTLWRPPAGSGPVTARAEHQ